MIDKNKLMESVIESLKAKDYTPQAVTIIKKSTDSILDRLKVTLENSLKDAANPSITEFSNKTIEKLNNLSQKWVNAETAELEVFPKGTKYIHKNGRITTIVIEQSPQTRNIKYLDEVYYLAFPYVQFTINFFDNSMEEVYMSMTKSPIKNLDGLLYYPCLPNVNKDHKVCFGDTKNKAERFEGSMSEKVKFIISTIWQSTFTADYSEEFSYFLRTNFENQETTKLNQWKEKSKENPLFVIEKTTKFKEGRTLKRFIRNDAKNESPEVVAAKMKNIIMDSVTSISTSLKESFSLVDVKEENIEKVHVDTMQQILKEIITLCYEVLWDFMQEEIKTEREKMKEEMKTAISSLKEDFKNFLESPYK
ncbi:MAG: hypothetical protein EKK64_00570 [Neisseriaceae bacterium]|nr:MAG: hypothetical protein EKK64_00570 [Neisseriaceae bacterium]